MAVIGFTLPIIAPALDNFRISPISGWVDWGEYLIVLVSSWPVAFYYGFLAVQALSFRRRHGRPPDQKDVEALG